MQQISNKTLTFLLLVAIVVSIAGTIISINRINQLILQAPIITGMATPTGTGQVNVTIASTTSITATDPAIQFGSCSPPITYGCNVSSNYTTDATFGCTCAGGSNPDNITIKNDGNKHVNVSVKIGTLAKTFIGGTIGGNGQADMWIVVRNSTDAPGCLNVTEISVPTGFDLNTGMQHDWKNLSSTTEYYPLCHNLTYGSTTNSIYVFAKLFVPANAPPGSNKTTTLTFSATNW